MFCQVAKAVASTSLFFYVELVHFCVADMMC